MKKKEYILGIETALDAGSLALMRGGSTIAARKIGKNASSSRDLLPLISEMLESGKIGVERIEQIAVSTGPGSLTGIRVGIATAQALSTALDCECLRVSVLRALALTVEDSLPVLVISAAGNQFCWQVFPSGRNERDETQINYGGRQKVLRQITGLPDKARVIAASAMLRNMANQQKVTNHTGKNASDNAKSNNGFICSDLTNKEIDYRHQNVSETDASRLIDISRVIKIDEITNRVNVAELVALSSLRERNPIEPINFANIT